MTGGCTEDDEVVIDYIASNVTGFQTSCAGGRHSMPPPLQVDLESGVSESRVTWATSVPILVSLGLSDLDLGPMYVTDRRQTRIIA